MWMEMSVALVSTKLFVGVSDHLLVNFVICASDPDGCARRTQGFILVRTERPYVQFAAARVTGTWFVVGVTNRRERERIPSL